MNTLGRITLAVLLLISLLSGQLVGAATYYVSPSGLDANPGTQAAPFATIQRAADRVVAGDTVIVKDGVYTSGTNPAETVIFRNGGTASQWITFKAENKWGAILDGQNNFTKSAFTFYPTSNVSYISVQDFEVRNFNFDAFHATKGPNIIISGNHIHHIGRICSDSVYGFDAIFMGQGVNFVTIERNLIHDIGRLSQGESGCNQTTGYYENHDHGIYAAGNSTLIIRNNIFYHCNHGWCIHVFPDPSSNVQIIENTFALPNPYRPGHILLGATITNMTIHNNIFYQPTTGAIRYTRGTLLNVQVNNNITYQGTIDATPTSSGITFSGNLDNTDPKLVNSSGLDFHLLSGSPAIDAGVNLSSQDVTIDFDGVSRFQGAAYDIGAYEYHQVIPLGAPTGLNVR